MTPSWIDDDETSDFFKEPSSFVIISPGHIIIGYIDSSRFTPNGLEHFPKLEIPFRMNSVVYRSYISNIGRNNTRKLTYFCQILKMKNWGHSTQYG